MNEELKEISSLTTEQLHNKWQELFHRPSPYRASREFLLGHIAWQIQAKALGGLNRHASRHLNNLIQQLSNGCTKPNEAIIKPGTKLLRNYQGMKHEVIVSEAGYNYQNKTYKSLSAIARTITGTQWNGKLFFGIKQ